MQERLPANASFEEERRDSWAKTYEQPLEVQSSADSQEPQGTEICQQPEWARTQIPLLSSRNKDKPADTLMVAHETHRVLLACKTVR